MRIPRHWKQGTFKGVGPEGRPITYRAWGWSDASTQEAEKNGNDRAYQAFRKHQQSDKKREYDYLDIPLREEISDTVFLGNQEIARITRNHYGSLVLNAANVLFVDVDNRPPRTAGFTNWFRFQFSRSYREKKLRESEDQALNTIIDWSVKNPRRSFRLYKTRAGYRIMFTDKLYEAQSEEVAGIFDQFDADRLYRILTRRQECFRARLTPKAWRIGLKDPRHKYPEQWETYSAEFQAWLKAYNAKLSQFSVCQLLKVFGPEVPSIMEIQKIITLHDEFCCHSTFPLA